MKTLKIFLASSEELKEERNTMADLILHLNKLFKGRGLELELEKWEYLDASMTGKRKQDEYNGVLMQCDICMVLFWRRFGSYTGEELDTAYQRMRQKEKPYKIYVFFKNPNSDEVTQELKDFIANYEQRYGGHFFCKFQNVDTMKLEFLLQLENYQKDLIGEKAIEVRNEHVYVDNEALIDLNNIPFAAQNEGFKKLQSELASLREKIIEQLQQKQKEKEIKLERKKAKLEKDPDDKEYQEDVKEAQEAVDEIVEDLQQYIDKKNKLEEDYDREQQNLFNTARRITEQRGMNISERMTRAIEAFESGNAKRADIILDEAEKDADLALADIRMAKEIGLKSLEELILKTSTKMSNDSIPIDLRVNETLKIYGKAEKLAKEIGYNEDKYAKLLFSEAELTKRHAFYEKALMIYEQVVSIIERCHGDNYPGLVPIYNAIGELYYNQSKYLQQKEWHTKALTLAKNCYGIQHPETAESYNDLGIALGHLGDIKGSLDYIQTAFDIRVNILGENHLDTAESYNNLGCFHSTMAEYNEAIIYHKKSLAIREKLSGNSILVAQSYNNLGDTYYQLGDYVHSRECILKSKEIIVNNLGAQHPEYANICNMLALIAHAENKLEESLNLYMKSLRIKERVYGRDSIPFALVCGNIGCLYFDMGEFGNAGHYQRIATRTYEKIFGTDHPDTALQYDNLGYIYGELGNFDKSIEYYKKALTTYENVYGSEHPDTKRIKETLVSFKGLNHKQ